MLNDRCSASRAGSAIGGVNGKTQNAKMKIMGLRDRVVQREKHLIPNRKQVASREELSNVGTPKN